MKTFCFTALLVFTLAVGANAYTAKDFFEHPEPDNSMVGYIVNDTDATPGAAHQCLASSYQKAMEFIGAKNYEQAYAAGKMAWYCGVYERMLLEDEKEQGKNVSSHVENNIQAMTKLANFFIIKTEKDFTEIFDLSVNKIQAQRENAAKTASKKTSTVGAAPDELEKYFGEYEYQAGPDCGGKLTLSRADGGNYLVAVDNVCGNEEMLATCGEDFVASIVSREPNNAFLLKELEYGVYFLVNANGIEADKTPVGLCGQGGYMHGKYVRASSKDLQKQGSGTPVPHKEKPTGKVLDLYGDIPRSTDLKIASYMTKDPIMTKYPPGKMPMIEAVGFVSRGLEKSGYSYDATVFSTFNNCTRDNLLNLQLSGSLNMLGSVLGLAQEEGGLEQALERGYLSEASVQAVRHAVSVMQKK